MKNEKGILGKLLSVVGVILVMVGVFVFQGISNADNEEGTPASGVGLSITGGDEEETEGETTDGSDSESEEPEDAENQIVFEVKYYIEKEKVAEDEDPLELVDTQTSLFSAEEKSFSVSELIPEGKGDFLGWYKEGDKETREFYRAGDEIILKAADAKTVEKEDGTEETKVELKLIARFAVLGNYVLRYNASGGTGAPNAQTCTSYYGNCEFVVANVQPAREGYEFRGWNRMDDTSRIYKAGETIVSTSADEPLTLYAVWAEIKTYTLMYDVNGGSGAIEVQACKSASGQCQFTLSTAMPTRVGFEFVGWQKGDETLESGAGITVTSSNTILVAVWNPIYKITLSYVSDGEVENLPDSQKCETVEGTCSFIVPDKEPTRKGYKFKGWRWEDQAEMLAKAGDELVVDAGGGTDLKIHAVWSRIYTVLNSGEVFGAGERVVLRSVANYGKFKKLVIDSQEVPEEYYVASESDITSIALSNAFSQSLSSGEHGFEITWEDGEANGIISVNQSEDGTKRFVVVDGAGTTEGVSLMYRPKAGAVSKESGDAAVDSATDNNESNFDAVRTLILVAVGAFVVVYIVNRFYVRHRMDFIENF